LDCFSKERGDAAALLAVDLDAQANGRTGPRSTGFALYGDAAPDDAFKVTLYAPCAEYDWTGLEAELRGAFLIAAPTRYCGSHAVFVVAGDSHLLFDWFDHHRPELRVFGFGKRIEVLRMSGYRMPWRTVSNLSTDPARTPSATRKWRRKAQSQLNIRIHFQRVPISARFTTARYRITTGTPVAASWGPSLCD
jgi:hypothetical protein